MAGAPRPEHHPANLPGADLLLTRAAEEVRDGGDAIASTGDARAPRKNISQGVNFSPARRNFMGKPAMRSDPHEVSRLYQQHGAEVLSYLARRCPAEAAQDLLQETFLQVMRSADRLGSVTMPRAWIFGIARNILALHFRRNSGEELAVEASAEPSEDRRLPAMREAIAQLPPELRETLELRLTDELSYEEIASVLAVPIGTVRSRLHNAVRRLRTALTNPETKL
jgi:RNA polymerase sigma-70 factor (ECF subfamily)